MKKLTVLAAALAAATTVFCAQAQDLPAKAGAAAAGIAGKAAGEAKGLVQNGATATTGAEIAKQPCRNLFDCLGMGGSKDDAKAAATTKTRKDAPAKALRYSTIIERYARTYGVPVTLAHAVVRVESNYRPNARGSAGEIGLMQIKPATARMMGYSGSSKGLYDPETNIKFGMKYLGEAQRLGGGTTCGTILKYNAGHGARRMNKVSSAYCAKVKRHMDGDA